MLNLEKIVKSFSAIIVLAAFFVSTTGFTFYNHVCQHHGEEVTIAITSCCSEEVAEIPEPTKNCCETETSSKSCNVENEVSDCCEFNMQYFHLSERFIDPQTDSKTFSCSESEINLFDPILSNEVKTDNDFIPDNYLIKKKPKEPIFRLYQQVKIDPPLI